MHINKSELKCLQGKYSSWKNSRKNGRTAKRSKISSRHSPHMFRHQQSTKLSNLKINMRNGQKQGKVRKRTSPEKMEE